MQIEPSDVMHTWHVCQPAEPKFHGLGTNGYLKPMSE